MIRLPASDLLPIQPAASKPSNMVFLMIISISEQRNGSGIFHLQVVPTSFLASILGGDHLIPVPSAGEGEFQDFLDSDTRILPLIRLAVNNVYRPAVVAQRIQHEHPMLAGPTVHATLHTQADIATIRLENESPMILTLVKVTLFMWIYSQSESISVNFMNTPFQEVNIRQDVIASKSILNELVFFSGHCL